MNLTRDSIIWTIGLIGGIASALAGNWHLFPWIPEQTQHYVSLAGFIAAIVSGKLATSPLQVSPEGHRDEMADHEKRVKEAVDAGKIVETPAPIPPMEVVGPPVVMTSKDPADVIKVEL